MLSTYERRRIGSCFYPLIYLDCSWDECYAQLEIANKVEAATKKMLDGDITAEEMLEMIEGCFDMDQYLDEVEENLEAASSSLILLW